MSSYFAFYLLDMDYSFCLVALRVIMLIQPSMLVCPWKCFVSRTLFNYFYFFFYPGWRKVHSLLPWFTYSEALAALLVASPPVS